MTFSNPSFSMNVKRLPKENIALGKGSFVEESFDGTTTTYTRINASNIPLTESVQEALPDQPTTIGEALINIISELNSGSINLKVVNNLSDVDNKATARGNLEVLHVGSNLDDVSDPALTYI